MRRITWRVYGSGMSDPVVAALQCAFVPAADPERAAAMAAYMRNRFAFLGLPSPRRRNLQGDALAGLAGLDEARLATIARELWDLPQREYQYAACDLIRRCVPHCSPAFLDVLEELVTTRSWWDTVDALAHAVGELVLRHPSCAEAMERWARSEDVWLIRVAIIHQLGCRQQTDAARLFSFCAEHAGHPDFFVRKGIGWALREYGKTDPGAVRAFVDAHPGLSSLSRREALRRIEQPQRRADRPPT